MKTRILLLAGLMAAALTACNKEENQEGPAGPQQGHIPGDGAYMQLQIIGPTSGAATRTTPAEDGEETGSDDENRIPVLFEAPILVGTASGRLKEWSGLKHPFSSLVKRR